MGDLPTILTPGAHLAAFFLLLATKVLVRRVMTVLFAERHRSLVYRTACSHLRIRPGKVLPAVRKPDFVCSSYLPMFSFNTAGRDYQNTASCKVTYFGLPMLSVQDRVSTQSRITA